MARTKKTATVTCQSLVTSDAQRPASWQGVGDERSGMLLWLVALLTARWMLPTEGSAEGLTLWLTQLVLLTAAVKAGLAWRFQDRPAQFGLMDAAIGLLVLAQSVSALAVVFTVGDQRAALNIAWEWIGSAVLIWLLRQEVRSVRTVKEVCLGLSLTAAVLSGYGVWQSYVWYPELAHDFGKLHGELTELMQKSQTSGQLSSRDAQRMTELQTELARQGVPADEHSLQMWKQRVADSREPIGFFGLANSLAGVLMVMLLLTAGLTARREALWPWFSMALIAFCLMLTKSRTAWVGTFAGVGWWGLRAVVRRRNASSGETAESRTNANTQKLVAWILLGGLGVAAVVGIGAASGGLDMLVLSEAPKSLRYRLEYWEATWATIREHFWLGTGPGNFRDYYVQHKLPQSSEEVADPHNLVLDVWANAGVLGFLGLLACVSLMFRTWLSSVWTASCPPSFDNGTPKSHRGGAVFSSPVCGAGLGFVLAALGLEAFGQGTDVRLWWSGLFWWLAWGTLAFVAWRGRHRQTTTKSDFDSPTMLAMSLEAANLALLVHLLGAGGIAMPAITVLLWLVWGLRGRISCVTDGEAQTFSSTASAIDVSSGRTWLRLAGATSILSLFCLFTATLPDLKCRVFLTLGDMTGDLGKYAEAAAADPLSSLPYERASSVYVARYGQQHFDEDFDLAEQNLQRLIERRPASSWPWRRRGELWQSRFAHTKEPADARRAAESFQEATIRYPHHGETLANQALAWSAAGQSDAAHTVARRALQQDDINRKAGHRDKYLPHDVRTQIERLAQPDKFNPVRDAD